MATLNLGRIKPVFRGAYAGGTAYVVDDIVTSGNETFICILASTGNATSNATYWTKLAAKGTDGTDVGTTITTQGDILYRDGSGLQRLAKGTAGQTLTMNNAANAPEWGSGFDGTYKFHSFQRYSYNSSVGVSTLSGGEADGQRDCVLIAGSNYFTVTPAHADDVFEFVAGVNYYLPSNNAYGGLGFMSSTATDFSANRVFLFRSGQHSMGNGSGSGDEYAFKWVNYMKSASDLGFSANTTYYVRVIGQKHTTNNTLNFNHSTGTNNDGRHYAYCKHWKKQT